jgi:hypothetical protein
MQEDLIGDLSSWSAEEIDELWKEFDRLRQKAVAEGWEDEFLSNAKEWSDAGGSYPVHFLKMRRKDWKI